MTASDAPRTAVPAEVTTPPRIETGIGTLEFTDGYPTPDTASRLRDHLDYLHGVEAFMNSIQGVSTYAIRDGFLNAGVMDGDVLIFSELVDSRTLLLTPNADTVYFWTFLDLSHGPLVVETPVDTLGMVDDMWWGWVTDFGLPGPDRGRGGTYLLVPPGHEGPLPEDGFITRRRANQPRAGARPRVHQPERGQRPGAHRCRNQGAAEDLPLRRGRRRHQHRQLPRRRCPGSRQLAAARALASWRGPGWR